MSRPALGNLVALAGAVVAAGLSAVLFLASRPGDPLAALGYPGLHSPFLALGALVPLMLWLELAPQQVSAWVGALGALLLGAGMGGLAAYGGALSVVPAVTALGYPLADAQASALLAAALQTAPLVGATLLSWYAVRRGRRAPGFFAFAWVAAEGLAPLGAERLSVALHEHIAWIALASIGGPSLVSLFFALINGALAECLLFALPSRRRPYLVLAAAVGLAGSFGIHTIRVSALDAAASSAPTVRVLVVQPGAGDDPAQVEQTRAALEVQAANSDSDSAAHPIDLVVWPGVRFDPPLGWTEQDLAPRLPIGVDTPFVVGAPMVRDDPPVGPQAQVVVLTDDARQRQAFYQATVLAPFLDFAPLEDSLPASTRARIHDAGRRPGQRGAMFELNRVPFGVMAGWDDISGPDLRRQLADQEPEWLLSVVDDRDFAGTPLPAYHQACAVFRAIEQGRYLVRASAEGGSALIDPLGAAHARMPLAAPGAAIYDVPRLRAATGYQLVGNFVTLLCLLFAVSLVLLRPAASPAGPEGDDEAGVT
jgi:apolipoprotein N-acyltransferase